MLKEKLVGREGTQEEDAVAVLGFGDRCSRYKRLVTRYLGSRYLTPTTYEVGEDSIVDRNGSSDYGKDSANWSWVVKLRIVDNGVILN